MADIEIGDPEERPWRWKNTRALGVSLRLQLWPWRIQLRKEADFTGFQGWLVLGPVILMIDANHSDPNELFGLSESEAWERSA